MVRHTPQGFPFLLKEPLTNTSSLAQTVCLKLTTERQSRQARSWQRKCYRPMARRSEETLEAVCSACKEFAQLGRQTEGFQGQRERGHDDLLARLSIIPTRAATI